MSIPEGLTISFCKSKFGVEAKPCIYHSPVAELADFSTELVISIGT